MAWYVAIAIGLVLLARQGLIGKVIAFGAIVAQTYILFGAFEGTLHRGDPSFRGFYAESLFDQVKEELGNPAGYRVLSVGMHPSIAQYNGFYTLDGYMVDYPLAYKHQFKKLIQGELDKAPALDHYYTRWGSRAYGFSAALGREYVFPKGNKIVLQNLDYNWDQFRAMGGRYIFAPFPIEDEALHLKGVFKDSDAAWDLYVYTVAP